MIAKSARAWAAFQRQVHEQGGEVLEPTWLGARKGHRVRCAAGHENTPMPTNVTRGTGICLTCAGQDPQVAWAAFKSRVEELGGRVTEPAWLGASVRHRVVCSAGHETTAHPNFVQQGGGICGPCGGRDPIRAFLAFKARVEELGGIVLETQWLGLNEPHRVRCSEGHEKSPRPAAVRRGGGICGTCAGNDTIASRATFFARVAELGGVVLDTDWRGVEIRYRVRCVKGHVTSPLPRLVRLGGGICRVCSGRDAQAAWAAFRRRVEAIGGEVLESEWLGNHAPHRVRCAEGHKSAPTPANVSRGGGICRTCAGQDPQAAWAAFCDAVEALDGEVLEPEWLGSKAAHRVRCAEGHETTAYPGTVRSGGGICRVCAGTSPEVAWESFRAAVEELGGDVLESAWLGANARHRIRCAYGHQTAPYPTLVQQGGGVCRICSGRAWDVFYVVADPQNGHVKFGITSGSGRPRLRVHARDGFGTVLHLSRALPLGTALEWENAMKRRLRELGRNPVRGREYFDASATPIILETVGAWMGAAKSGGTVAQDRLF